MRHIEELSMNAWPALQTALYDGWVLRFADGYTKRSNSVNPIYSSPGCAEDRITTCEKLYGERGLKTIFKISPAISPGNLDSLLEAQGYQAADCTSVRLLTLENVQAPSIKDIVMYEFMDTAWVEDFCSFSVLRPGERATVCKILRNIIPPSFYVSLRIEGQAVACGSAVLENGYMGLYNIVVDRNYRNCGYGEQLVRHMLRLGKSKGAQKAYLQVMVDNAPAVRLYSKLGFKEVYQYWYRVK